MNLFDTLKEAMTDEVVSKIAKFVDEEPEKTEKALDSINYTLVAGLIKRTGSNMGINMLFNQVQRGNFNGSLMNSLTDSLGRKPKMEEILKTGDGLLSQLFPAYKSPLTSMIGAYAGIKKASSSTLSSLSAAVLIDALGKQMIEKKMDADELTNYLIDHHEPLFEKAPEDLMEKMIPSLGLQELNSGKFNATKKVPVQRTPQQIVKPVSSLDKPIEDENEAFGSRFPIKWLLIGLVAATIIGGGIYYYLTFVKTENVATPAEEIPVLTDTTIIKKDTLAVKKDSTTAKKDSTKPAVILPSAAEQFSSFGEGLNKYLADAAAPAGSAFDMKNVKFLPNSPKPDADSDIIIGELVDLMKKYPKSQIKILGYATGSIKNLGTKRASSIKLKLQAKGIEEKRIDFGSESGEENKVAIKIVSK